MFFPAIYACIRICITMAKSYLLIYTDSTQFLKFHQKKNHNIDT
uniref:Uncharacterized protein n=1 Tax=Anguilla anguilla TaxID=7936 RepID=A0A0E9S2E6_ANGAN